MALAVNFVIGRIPLLVPLTVRASPEARQPPLNHHHENNLLVKHPNPLS